MVGTFSLFGMVFSLLIALVGPVVLAILWARKTPLGARTTLAGAGTFIVFALILEQLLHYVVLVAIPNLGATITGNPLLMGLYGGFAAGIFEEVGRFLVLSFILRKSRCWKQGVAFGIGHGGIEAFILLGLTSINNLAYSLMINSGSFDSIISAVPAAQQEPLMAAKDALISTSSAMFFVGGLERIFAVTCHIAFTLIVLYAIRKRKIAFLGLAILLHAALDFPAALCQAGVIPIWGSEVILGIFAAASLTFIILSKKIFAAIPEEGANTPPVASPVN